MAVAAHQSEGLKFILPKVRKNFLTLWKKFSARNFWWAILCLFRLTAKDKHLFSSRLKFGLRTLRLYFSCCEKKETKPKWSSLAYRCWLRWSPARGCIQERWPLRRQRQRQIPTPQPLVKRQPQQLLARRQLRVRLLVRPLVQLQARVLLSS